MSQAVESAGATSRRDPYEVLNVPRDATEDQIKTAYRKMALKFHPDKNANNPDAGERFKEVAYAYGILSNPEKRRQFDTAGFDAVDMDGFDDSFDISNLGFFGTAVISMFSKLGVPIKTSISANVMEECLSGAMTIISLPLGRPTSGQVARQCAHYYAVNLSEKQAQEGLVVRVTSDKTSKFKLLYLQEEGGGGVSISMQENSLRTGKITSAGLYFLGFQVYRLDPNVNTLEVAKEPEAALFRKLDSLQPCEISELKPGIHTFAVYGDNFFNSTSYVIEASPVEADLEAREALRELEGQLAKKRGYMHQFERDYRQAQARFAEMVAKFNQEKLELDDLLNIRAQLQEKFTTASKARVPPAGVAGVAAASAAPSPSAAAAGFSSWFGSGAAAQPAASDLKAEPFLAGEARGMPEGTSFPEGEKEKEKTKEGKAWSFKNWKSSKAT